MSAPSTVEKAGAGANRLRDHDIYIKPLDDPRLGPGYMRVKTARPSDNERVVDVLTDIL